MKGMAGTECEFEKIKVGHLFITFSQRLYRKIRKKKVNGYTVNSENVYKTGSHDEIYCPSAWVVIPIIEEEVES